MLENFAIIGPGIGLIVLPSLITVCLVFAAVSLPKKQSSHKLNRVARVLEIILYHTILVIGWIFTWPQYTNTIHSGYSIVGMFYVCLYIAIWTAVVVLCTYCWRLIQNSAAKFPSTPYILLLFLWNMMFFILSRQVVYACVTIAS